MTGQTNQGIDWTLARERLALSGQFLSEQSSDPERIKAVYRERADALAARAGPSLQEVERLRVVLFRLAGDCYAAPLAAVERIIADPVLTPLPGVAARWAGVIVADGEIVPVLDLPGVLGSAEPEQSVRRSVLKLRQAQPECGLLVGEVLEIRDMALSELRPFTGNVPSVEAVAPGNVLVLDVDSLVAQEHLK